jgi:hypothetical protein
VANILEEDKLLEALETIRRDKHEPWRYILFTFANGIAWGLGMALGMSLVLGIVVYILTHILTQMINFPVIGQYVGELMKVLDAYIKQGAKVR